MEALERPNPPTLPALAGRWRVFEATVVTPIGGVDIALLPADPMRWSFLAWASAGGGFARLSAPPSGVTQWGLVIPTAAPYLALNYRDHGGLVQQAWKANGGGGPAVTVYVVSVSWV